MIHSCKKMQSVFTTCARKTKQEEKLPVDELGVVYVAYPFWKKIL